MGGDPPSVSFLKWGWIGMITMVPEKAGVANVDDVGINLMIISRRAVDYT